MSRIARCLALLMAMGMASSPAAAQEPPTGTATAPPETGTEGGTAAETEGGTAAETEGGTAAETEGGTAAEAEAASETETAAQAETAAQTETEGGSGAASRTETATAAEPGPATQPAPSAATAPAEVPARTTLWVLVAGSGTALAVGTVFGLRALELRDDARELPASHPQRRHLRDKLETAETVSDVALLSSLALGAAALSLVLHDEPSERAGAPAVAAGIAPDGALVTLRGAL